MQQPRPDADVPQQLHALARELALQSPAAAREADDRDERLAHLEEAMAWVRPRGAWMGERAG